MVISAEEFSTEFSEETNAEDKELGRGMSFVFILSLLPQSPVWKYHITSSEYIRKIIRRLQIYAEYISVN